MIQPVESLVSCILQAGRGVPQFESTFGAYLVLVSFHAVNHENVVRQLRRQTQGISFIVALLSAFAKGG